LRFIIPSHRLGHVATQKHHVCICVYVYIHVGFDTAREQRKIRFTFEAAISIPDFLVSFSFSVYLCLSACLSACRYMRLEHLAARPAWDGREAYEGSMTKEQRRIELAKMLSTEVSVVPPSRLLVLINQVRKWKHTASRNESSSRN
jgi:hypothetical protein